MCDGLLSLLGWLLLGREDLDRQEQLTYCHWFDEQCEGRGGEEEEVGVGGCGGREVGTGKQHLTLER